MVNSSKSKEERKAKVAKLVKKTKGKERDWFKIGTILAAVALVLVAGTATVVFGGMEREATTVEASSESPINAEAGGYTVTKEGIVETPAYDFAALIPTASTYDSPETNLTTYVDYACPACKVFDEANFEQIKVSLEDGTLDSFTIKPVVFLSEYSLFAANAMACVAETSPANILDVHEKLLSNQTLQKSETQTLDDLYSVGVPESEAFSKCVRGGKFNNYAVSASDNAQAGPIPNSNLTTGIPGTPAIFINGEQYPGNPDPVVFADFVSLVKSGLTLEEITQPSP